jgi:site-specific recombinase XerD
MHTEYGDVDSDYVFVNLWSGRIGAPMTYAAVHDLVGRIRARTGIDFTLHMLRHTHATELIRSGVAIEVVARLLTHNSSTTTSQTYVHLDTADIRKALQRAGMWDQWKESQ